jgi:hypothetical protein
MPSGDELFRFDIPGSFTFAITGPKPLSYIGVPTQSNVRVGGVILAACHTVVLGEDIDFKSGGRCQPFLFEETEYQFELVCRHAGVKPTQIELRLRGVNLLKDRRPIGDALVFAIPVNFRSQVGYTDLELVINKRLAFKLRLEVFPSKIDYRTDLAALRADLQQQIRALSFALTSKTYQEARVKRGAKPEEVEWLSTLRRNFDRVMAAFRIVERCPRTVLRTCEEIVKGNRPVRAGGGTLRFLRTHSPYCIPTAAGHFEARGQRWHATKIPDERKLLSFDTPENRFLKAATSLILRRVRNNRSELLSLQKKDEFEAWYAFLTSAENRLERMCDAPFLRDISLPGFSRSPTLALNMTPGYREFFAAFIELFGVLEISGGPVELPEKDLWTLYELWCFISVANILRNELGLMPTKPAWLRVERSAIGVAIAKGKASELRMESDKGDIVTITYNQKDSTPTGDCRPDNTLEIRKQDPHAVFRYVFDAKYRLRTDADYVERQGAPGPPEDAIHRMHAYRDQIVAEESAQQTSLDPARTVWDLGYRRYVQQSIGAFVLYPYAGEDAHKNKFFKSITKVGVGGLPFLPSRRTEVTNILRRIIAATSESVSDSAIELSSVEERRRIEWAHEFGLLGIVSSQEQLEYIKKYRIYHMPYNPKVGLRLRADFILLLLSQSTFGKQAGAAFEARVRAFHMGTRDKITPRPPESRRGGSGKGLYAWFTLRDLKPIEPPLPYNGKPPNFGTTTRLALSEAHSLPDLLLIREPERRLHQECLAAGFTVDIHDAITKDGSVYDLNDLRLRFVVRDGNRRRVDVRFNPATTQFSAGGLSSFTWSELMFTPESCLARIRDAVSQSALHHAR